jgi:hypothetical protein
VLGWVGQNGEDDHRGCMDDRRDAERFAGVMPPDERVCNGI